MWFIIKILFLIKYFNFMVILIRVFMLLEIYFEIYLKPYFAVFFMMMCNAL